MNYLNKAVSSFYTIFEILSIHFGERRTMYYSYWRKKDNVLFILEKEGQCIIHIGERRTMYYSYWRKKDNVLFILEKEEQFIIAE